jgi:conjugative transfer signal peptidase TraF
MNPIQCIEQSKFLKFFYGLIGLMSLLVLACHLFGIRLYWNTTASNPYTLFIGSTCYIPQKDSYIVAFPSSSLFKKNLHAIPVIKKIKGMPGDQLKSSQTTVFLNEQNMGQIENLVHEDFQLSAIESQVIPEDFYYLGSDYLNKGFDSRYAQFGLIHKENIRCRVWPIY